MSTQIRATPYPTLFSPIRIGSVTLRNRIVNLPQGMGYTNSGLVVDEDIAYHRRRALGGVGLVVTGGTATDPTSTDRTRNFVEMYEERVPPGLRQRAGGSALRLRFAVFRGGLRLFGGRNCQ